MSKQLEGQSDLRSTNASSAVNRTTEDTATGDAASSPGGDDNACVVCFKNVDIYSVGECDHPVCHECSTRMRVLCQQNECPICRQVLNKVIFTGKKGTYRELEAQNRSVYYNKKYKISFANNYIQQAFYRLLDHPCPKCDAPPYRNFNELSNHVKREHEMYYCDICVENLKIFSFERSVYTQADLGLHRTKGDADNKSHRGHPSCGFCKKRYLDRDELFKHSRREHFFCHFCDADGRNEFYRDYDALADHFRQEHFLCEEGKCATEQFIGAFRTEIDYKAHVAGVHGKSLNKQQAKQTRTLQLEITLGPRGRSGQPEQHYADVRSRNNEPEDIDSHEPPVQNVSNKATIDARNEEEFPSLAGASTGPNLSLAPPPPPVFRNTKSGLARTQENFPSLGGGGVGGGPMLQGQRTQSGRGPSSPIASMLKNAPNASTGAIARTTSTATTKAGGSSSGVVLHVSNRPAQNNASAKQMSSKEFPALSAGSKKTNRKLYEDFGGSEVENQSVNHVSAKHRQLMDDYVSVAHPNHFQKLQLVQKEEAEAAARKNAAANDKRAPKLTTADFPSLGPSGPNTGQMQSSWAKPQNKKQRELENRKSKVAPAPLLAGKETARAANNKTTANINASAASVLGSIEATKKKSKEKINVKLKENNNNNNKSSNTNLNLVNTSSIDDIIRQPPPFGFTHDIKPPPGFQSNVTLNSVAKSPNDLTFTTSQGESYRITSAYLYEYPPDATARNMKLVGHFKETLKTPEGVDQFRVISQRFRDGQCKPSAYYEHCQVALKDKFNKVFPELLALLPDISKQQMLYLLHQQYLNEQPANERKSLPQLKVCSTCKQVVLSNDFEAHEKVHSLKNNFPSLGLSNKNAMPKRK